MRVNAQETMTPDTNHSHTAAKTAAEAKPLSPFVSVIPTQLFKTNLRC